MSKAALHGTVLLLVFAIAVPVVASGASAREARSGTIIFSRNSLVENKGEGRRFREVHHVWLIDGDGTNLRQMRPRLEGIPEWIAGGRRIAVGARGGMITVNRAGRDRQSSRFGLRLDRSNRISGLDFAPDGRRFAFDYFSRQVDTTKVYVQSVAGQPRALPLGEATLLSSPAWAPDGTTIAATGTLPDVIVHPGPQYEQRPPTAGVWLLEPAGGEPRLLATWPKVSGTVPGEPAWSPDGLQLAIPYIIENPGGDNLDDYAQMLLVNARTGSVRQLLREDKAGTYYYEPSWSPNGRYLGYTRSEGANTVRLDIWVYDTRTRKTKNLTPGPQDVGGVSWAPDSRRLVLSCTSACGRPKGIWTLSLNRKWKRLTRGFDFDPSWAAL